MKIVFKSICLLSMTVDYSFSQGLGERFRKGIKEEWERTKQEFTIETQQLTGGIAKRIPKNEKNFELWNKSKDQNIYFALTPSLDELKTVFYVGPGERFNGTFEPQTTYYLIVVRASESPAEFKKTKVLNLDAQTVYKASPLKPETTIFVRLSEDGTTFGPQTGKFLGLGREHETESGLSLKNNVWGEETFEKRIVKKMRIGGEENFKLLRGTPPPNWFRHKLDTVNIARST